MMFIKPVVTYMENTFPHFDLRLLEFLMKGYFKIFFLAKIIHDHFVKSRNRKAGKRKAEGRRRIKIINLITQRASL